MPRVNTIAASKLTVEDYMEQRTDRTSGCWTWTGSVTWNGYGAYLLRDRRTRAHRVAYELAKGEIAEGLDIDHMCRNRLCVNPNHLQAVTRAENNENRSRKGNGSTGVRGVSLHKATGLYEAYATHGDKKHSAGLFPTVEAATAAVRDLRLKLHVNNLADRGNGASDGRPARTV